MRALATLLVLAAVLGLYLLMLRGWRSRQRRQADLPAPPTPPAVPGDTLVGAVPGLYVGTTRSEDWLDRIAVHDLGHRAAGWLLVTVDGVHVEREGLPDLYLPFAALDAVSTGDALAGRYIGPGGLLLLDWRLGPTRVTSGFRADDHAQHDRLVAVLGSQIRSTQTRSPEVTP